MQRSAIAMLVALVWLSSPVLACLPQPTMTAEEMACCQKMAGSCDMGGGNHKCCDAAANHAATSAGLVKAPTALDPLVAEGTSDAQVELIALVVSTHSDADWIEPTISPPRAPFILKN